MAGGGCRPDVFLRSWPQPSCFEYPASSWPELPSATYCTWGGKGREDYATRHVGFFVAWGVLKNGRCQKYNIHILLHILFGRSKLMQIYDILNFDGFSL